MRAYLFVIMVAAVVTYLMTPAARWLARLLGAMTPIRDRDVHSVPTPRLGGVAMLAGLAAAFFLSARIPFLDPIFENSNQVWGILAGATLVCLIGVADDVWDLDAVTKLVGQVLAAGIMAFFGVQVLSLPIDGLIIGSSRLSYVVTILAVVIAINAVNFVDGLDGLAAGVVAIGGSAFFLYSYLLSTQSIVASYSSLASMSISALVGCCIGFLPHNFHPARIFMGDSGAMLLGLVLAGSGIVITGQVDPGQVSSSQLLPAFVPILLPIAVMIVPLTDLVLAVFRRVSKGKSPFHADRRHLHHQLLSLGHSHRGAVLIMYVWTAIFGYGAAILVLPAVRPYVGWIWAGEIIVGIIVTILPARLRRRKIARDVPTAIERSPS